MLSLKTTATLIAAISVLATTSVASALIPQAFANDQTPTATVNQGASQTANNNGGDVQQTIEQQAQAEANVCTLDIDNPGSFTPSAEVGHCT